MRLFALTLAAAILVAAPLAAQNRKKSDTDRRGSIHGHLLDYSGVGLTGVIALCAPDGRKIRYYNSWAFDKGKFEMDNLLPGTYILHLDTVAANVEGLHSAPDLRIVVEPGKRLRPRMIVEPGEPVGPQTN